MAPTLWLSWSLWWFSVTGITWAMFRVIRLATLPCALQTTLTCRSRQKLISIPAPPNYPFRHPNYHLMETMRPFIDVPWGVQVPCTQLDELNPEAEAGFNRGEDLAGNPWFFLLRTRRRPAPHLEQLRGLRPLVSSHFVTHVPFEAVPESRGCEPLAIAGG